MPRSSANGATVTVRMLCFDEVQAGFGRCGTLWGFELYGVVPDLFCLGKGISSSLPISAVIGRPDVMDLYGPNEMTSTHSGNAVCCAAALASIETILEEKLIENAARLGPVLKQELAAIQERVSRRSSDLRRPRGWWVGCW